MAHDLHVIEVVHPGAAERPVGGGKAGRLDDVRFDAEAGGEAKDGPGVLGNVGLEKGDAHDLAASSLSDAAARSDVPFPRADVLPRARDADVKRGRGRAASQPPAGRGVRGENA
jgi:hypothetical protein